MQCETNAKNLGDLYIRCEMRSHHKIQEHTNMVAELFCLIHTCGHGVC